MFVLANEYEGEINQRTASIAILIMIIFPNATPVSEKTLQLFMQIYTQCLPSEHMNHSYSIATTATTTFTLLHQEDPILSDHIEAIFSKGYSISSILILLFTLKELNQIPEC